MGISPEENRNEKIHVGINRIYLLHSFRDERVGSASRPGNSRCRHCNDQGAMGGRNQRSDKCRRTDEGRVGRLHRIQRRLCHASRWKSDEFTPGGSGRKSFWQDDRGGNGQPKSPGIQRECCRPDLQLCRRDPGQGRKDGTGSRKIDARLCEKGRQMDVGPRKLWLGSTAKIIRLRKSEKGAASARFALLAASYLVPT